MAVSERLFFAVDVDAHLQTQISDWRRRHLPDCTRPVLAKNYHITLAFLGQTESRRIPHLIDAADHLVTHSFDLQLNNLGYFAKPKVLWLGPDIVPQALSGLAEDCHQVARQCHLQVDSRPYRPHLTLARKVTALPEINEPVEFELAAQSFSLYRSVAGPRGVRYHALTSWRLG